MQALLHKRALLPVRRVGQPAAQRQELRARLLEPPVLQQAQRQEPPRAPLVELQVPRVERLQVPQVLLVLRVLLVRPVQQVPRVRPVLPVLLVLLLERRVLLLERRVLLQVRAQLPVLLERQARPRRAESRRRQAL